MKKEILDNQIKPLNLEQSYQMLNEARQVTPGGGLGIRKTESWHHFRRGRQIFSSGEALGIRKPKREYPVFFEKANGMHVVDVDGNDYIDYQCGWGPIVLSFVNEEINNAVINRIKKGFCFSGVQREKLKLEEKLKEVIPCCEKSIIVKTGSDAVTSKSLYRQK